MGPRSGSGDLAATATAGYELGIMSATVAPVPVYFEESWAILSSVCLVNVLFGFMIIGITALTPVSIVPIVVSRVEFSSTFSKCCAFLQVRMSCADSSQVLCSRSYSQWTMLLCLLRPPPYYQHRSRSSSCRRVLVCAYSLPSLNISPLTNSPDPGSRPLILQLPNSNTSPKRPQPQDLHVPLLERGRDHHRRTNRDPDRTGSRHTPEHQQPSTHNRPSA